MQESYRNINKMISDDGSGDSAPIVRYTSVLSYVTEWQHAGVQRE